MTKPINTESIEKATGKLWEAWVDELDERGARELSHTELAKLVNERLQGMESSDWWAQGITVAYEQHIGRRIPGQLANGLFEVAVSKSVAKPRSELFPALVEWLEDKTEFNDQVPLKRRSTETPKRSNWRCDFSDGSKFAATIEDSGDKSKLVLSHTAVPTKQESDEWKEYWRTVINEITK